MRRVLISLLLVLTLPAFGVAQTLVQPHGLAPGVVPGLTTGSVLFADGMNISQDNTRLFWDNTNKRLGIGTATPTTQLDVASGALSGSMANLWQFSGSLYSTGSGDRAGMYLMTTWDGGNTSSFHGLLSQASSSVDVTWIAALSAYARLASPVAVTNLISLMASGHAPIAGSTVTNLYGLYVGLGYAGDQGTVGTVYGIYTSTPAMPATTKYALYSEGNNVFKGRTAFASAGIDSTIAVEVYEVFDTASSYGLRVRAGNSGGSNVAIYGEEQGQGSGSNNVGVWGRGVKSGSTTLTEFVGVRGSITHATGTVTNAVSVSGLAPTGSGITNAWSGYFETPTAGSSSNLALRSDGPTALYGATSLIVETANLTPLTVSGYSLTGSSVLPMINLAGTWNTSGIADAIVLNITNTASDGASRLIDLKIGGVSQFAVTRVGNITTAGAITAAGLISTSGDVGAGAARDLYWSGRSVMQSPADGQVVFKNAAGTDFGLLQFGGTAATFPALKRSTTSLLVRLADDSGYGGFDASGYSAGGVAGLSETKTVRAAGGASDCTLIFTGGILTGGTC